VNLRQAVQTVGMCDPRLVGDAQPFEVTFISNVWDLCWVGMSSILCRNVLLCKLRERVLPFVWWRSPISIALSFAGGPVAVEVFLKCFCSGSQLLQRF
jgi:hypothetical protein